MFTGIITSKAQLIQRTRTPQGLHLSFESTLFAKPQIGASFAMDGVCLTQVDFNPGQASFDVITETLDKTTLSELQVGDFVHLESAMGAQSSFDGHMVQGHVDGVANLQEIQPTHLTVAIPKDFAKYLIMKGSIALDGVSLTIASLDHNLIKIALTPHTYQETLFQFKKPGDKINFEIDVFAKMVYTYTQRLKTCEVDV